MMMISLDLMMLKFVMRDERLDLDSHRHALDLLLQTLFLVHVSQTLVLT